MLDIRQKFPQEKSNFEPWIDELLALDSSLDDHLVYEEWRTPWTLNDGTSMPSLLTYEILARKEHENSRRLEAAD